MTYWQAIFLGILQGVGEFLPISSSAHLAVFPYFLNWSYQGLPYDVMLHLGTLLAVVSVFWKDWIEIIKQGLTQPSSNEGKLLWYIALASVPGAVAGYFLEHKAETVFREPWLIGMSLLIFSILIFLADWKATSQKALPEITWKDALLIGLAQSLAIIPGASRSGMTIMAALFLGYQRETAARFSFLLSTPIIAGAALLVLPKISPVEVNGPFFAGLITSALFGFLSIRFLLGYLKTRNLLPFVIYRVLLALVVFARYL
ncbi:MAG: undecaprenyl-diphosphatase UppP [Candidatus Aminicenantes bacterium]|nr:undecaprenyl-diphosphatase UppP [Candidatus Aminicenantes bacterium]